VSRLGKREKKKGKGNRVRVRVIDPLVDAPCIKDEV
jgi:hypothetical protein